MNLAACSRRNDRVPADTPPAGSSASSPAGSLEPLTSLGYVQVDADPDASLRGVTVWDVDRAHPGFNLFTFHTEKVYLTDLAGEVVHRWQLARGSRCGHAILLDDGRLLVECGHRRLTLLDWRGAVQWSLDVPVHHDMVPTPGGGFLVLLLDPPRRLDRFRLQFDSIAWISGAGEVERQWSMYDHRQRLARLHAPRDLPAQAGPGAVLDYYHTNSLQLLPPNDLEAGDPRFRAGHLLICLRNVDVIAILEPDSMEVTWSWGPGVVDRPHMPVMLDSGHILLFDNGPSREASRVLEVDPRDGRVVWQYDGTPERPLWSRFQSNAQRLPNGNTLICEGDQGHLLEVTHEGEVVWEYWAPHFTRQGRRRMYRVTRLPVETVQPLREASDGH